MKNTPPFTFQCSMCGDSAGEVEPVYTCPSCGGNVEVVIDVEAVRAQLSPERLRARTVFSIWRYADLLPVPVPPGRTPLHAVGWTPVHRPTALERELGVSRLLVKDESGNPTASFKDRASAVVVARALDKGYQPVITASSGNAGAAMAGMAAAAGMNAVILVPRTAPEAKIAQLRIYGARVVLVDGTYDEAYDLTLEAAKAWGWYCRNTGFNPFTLEGKKTAAFEIFEQCHELFSSGKTLVTLFVPVGDGNIISGIHKGFKELHSLGWIDQVPRIFGVQAAGSAAIAQAFRNRSEDIHPVAAQTIADSISVGIPRDGVRALRAARDTGGAYLTVTDDEILKAMVDLAGEGIFSEPAAAASFAGVRKAVGEGMIGAEETVVALVTGSGLKDVASAVKAAGAAPVIPPDLQSLQGYLEDRESF